MRMIFPFLAAAALALASCEQGPKRVTKLENPNAQGSYAVGLAMGKNFKQQGLEVDKDALFSGVLDALEDKTPLLDEEGHRKALMELQERLSKSALERFEKESQKNQGDQDKFLAENSKKTGVTTTASGIQYEILTAGKGKTPKPSDKVKVHYTGTLVDGTKFDSSVDRGTPAEFQLDGVIPGWTETLQLMPVGSKWRG